MPFAQRVSYSVLNKRILESRESLFSLVFIVFLIAYCIDEVVGLSFGLSQYSIAVIAVVTTLVAISGILLWDMTAGRWRRFFLNPGEILFAQKKDSHRVLSRTEEVQQEELEEFSDVFIVKTQPWVRRRLRCLVGKYSTTFLLTLEVVARDVGSINQWLKFSEDDVLSEFRKEVQAQAFDFGVGRALESPEEFCALLTLSLNKRLFEAMGVRITVEHLTEEEQVPMEAQSLTK